MPELTGGCTCSRVRYQLTLDSLDDARKTLCHCGACKRALGGAFGVTAKVPLSMFKLFPGDPVKVFVADSGVHREFCSEFGSFICEYGAQNVDKFRSVFATIALVVYEFALTVDRYVMTGTLDDEPDALPPKGQFFTGQRNNWMPQISVQYCF